VHAVETPDITLGGAHAIAETRRIGVTVTVAVAVPPSVAINVAVCEAATEPPVTVNVADVAAAGTVTDAGAGSAAVLLDDRATRLPPVGAAWFKLTVHVLAAPEITLEGAQTSDATRGLGVTVTVALVLIPSVAVTVTV